MKITELFSSIQGESTLAGLPTVFVRCTGCNLDCRYCDTPYARTGGEDIPIPELVKRIAAFNIRTVCITGGEPLLQPDLPALIASLIPEGFRISIETNGSLPTQWCPGGVTAVIDVKCPGSGMEGSFHEPNVTLRRPLDQFKFVIAGRSDFDFACNFVDRYALNGSNEALFSPALPHLAPAVLAGWMLDEFPRARLNLQLHRFIWPGENRGR